MKFPSLHILKISLALVAFSLCLSLQAAAACPEPPAGTLAICQPSANSTIYQVPHFEATANPTSGSISTMKVYIDNKLIFTTSGPELSLFEGGVANGTQTTGSCAAPTVFATGNARARTEVRSGISRGWRTGLEPATTGTTTRGSTN